MAVRRWPRHRRIGVPPQRDGLVSHGHIALADADAATVLQTDKKIIDARLTLKADFDSFGANPAALVRAAHGSGAIALADAHIAGLDPAAFVAAMHAADQGTAIELAKIQPAVNAALASGHLAAPQGDAAMMITDGKVSVANADGTGARRCRAGARRRARSQHRRRRCAHDALRRRRRPTP